MADLSDWIHGVVFDIEMAVRQFVTRLKCDEDGHPVTWTASNGTSGCSCGKVTYG